MFRILLIEDAKESQMIVRGALLNCDVELEFAETVAGALAELEIKTFDLIVLDLSLPDGSGFTILNHLSAKALRTRVILLTSESGVSSKVAAFDLGADEYLVKPIEPTEFRARVQALQRKLKARVRSPLIRCGHLSVDMQAMKVFVSQDGVDTPVDLTSKEFKILCCLMLTEESVCSRHQLMQQVWGGVHVLERTIDSHVCSLRKKLGPSCAGYIQSIPNEGYCLSPNASKLKKAMWPA